MQQMVLPGIDVVEVECPRCGHTFDPREALKVRLAALPETTQKVWYAGGWRWQQGLVQYGPTRLADKVGISPPAVRKHLLRLAAVGLVRAVPQNQYRRKRHLYTGSI